MKNDKEKRKLENEIVEFFTQNIPDIQEYVKDSFDGYAEDESVGLYILFPDILRYFEDCVKNRKKEKVKNFIEILEEFRDKFGKSYHKLTTETMDNFIGVAFFEDCVDGLNKEEIDFVLPLFSEKFTSEYQKHKTAEHQTLLDYLKFLLKGHVKNLKAGDDNKNNYKIFDVETKSDISSENIVDFISLTNKVFYITQANGYCYLGKLVKNSEIHLLYKDTLPMHLLQNAPDEIFN